MERFVKTLQESRMLLERLETAGYAEGMGQYLATVQLLEMIIERVYPQRLAGDLKRRLRRRQPPSEELMRAEYVEDVRFAIRLIDSMLEEHRMFGRRSETEWQLGSERFGFIRRRMPE